MREVAYVIVAVSCIAIAGLLGVLAYQNARLHSEPEVTTSFQAVQMTNGQVFFGRLERAGSAFPALRDAYMLQAKTNPETKQVTNTLIKRAQDARGQDAIFLNRAHILAIEAVTPGSNIDKLIQDARQAPAAPAK